MSSQEKRPFSDVMPVAQYIANALGDYCQRIAIAGSLRRKRSMIGDIEIVAIPRYQKNLFGDPDPHLPTELDRFLKRRLGDKLNKNGSKYKSFDYGKYKVDLFLATPRNFGNIFTIRTGSRDFSAWLMSSSVKGGALPIGMRQKDGYLWKGEKMIPCPDERDLFDAINIPFVPVSKRDNREWLAICRDA